MGLPRAAPCAIHDPGNLVSPTPRRHAGVRMKSACRSLWGHAGAPTCGMLPHSGMPPKPWLACLPGSWIAPLLLLEEGVLARWIVIMSGLRQDASQKEAPRG